MPKITDPDLLTQDIEVIFDTAAKTIELVIAGNLSTDGVALQALYSFCKEEWKNDSSLIMYPFPMVPITSEQFEFVNGWTYKDANTVNLFRDAGFAVKDGAGNSEEEYIGVITLGSIGSGDQVYYQQEVDGASTDVVLTGVVNQCVKVYGDVSNGDFDYRDYFKIFVREQAKTYADAAHTNIGVSTFTYQAYRFPLANGADLKVTNNDVTADAYGVTIEYFGSAQSRNIGGPSYDFSIIVDGNNRTAEEIYEAVQSALRKNSDIDDGAGTVTGKTADTLLKFVGDTLVTSNGVYIDNFQSADTNRIEFYDDTAVKRTFPFVATLTLNFSDTLATDGGAIYRLFETAGFGTVGATLVQNAGASDISGNISGAQVVTDYAYEANGNTDLDVTLVCIGLDKAQYVVATGTIERSNANSITATAALERNYQNA